MLKNTIVAAVVVVIWSPKPAWGYDKGLGPYFGDKEDEDWLADYVENIPDGCEFIFCPEHIYWTKLQKTVPTPDPHEIATWFPEIIDEADRDVYLGINLLSDDRTGLYTPIPSHVPISPPGPFASATVRTAFADECLEIMDHAWGKLGRPRRVRRPRVRDGFLLSQYKQSRLYEPNTSGNRGARYDKGRGGLRGHPGRGLLHP